METCQIAAEAEIDSINTTNQITCLATSKEKSNVRTFDYGTELEINNYEEKTNKQDQHPNSIYI